MRGLAWTAIIAAFLLSAGVSMGITAALIGSWPSMALAGVLAVAGVGFAMLSLRE